MTNVATIEVMEQAKMAGFENWLGQDSNRGWFTCEWTGKKFRGEVAMEMLAEQAQWRISLEEQMAIEDMQDDEGTFDDASLIEDIEADLAEAGEEKPVRKGSIKEGVGVKVFHNPMHDTEDTLGVLHANGMIDKITEKLAVHLELKMIEGKPVKMTTIKCADCQAEREIKVQDAFQVTRCVNCQKKHRNKQRAERRRQQRAERKAQEQESK